jgi:hypothetical protein
LEAVLKAREDGLTVRQAAAAAGIHVATLCQWKARSEAVAEALEAARRVGWRLNHPDRRRPSVPWRKDCPQCGAAVEVRHAGIIFWRCSRWPLCPWASWRPRHPQDCPGCGSYRLWSHSRLSVACPGCGVRVKAEACE